MFFDLKKALMAVAVVLVGGVGLLIGVVSSSNSASVLAECEATVDESLQKAYSAGSSTLEAMNALVMDGAVSDVRSRIRSFLELPVTDTQTLAQYMSLFHPNVSDNWAFVDSTIRPYMAAAMEIKAAKGLVELNLWGGGGVQNGLPLGETSFMLGFYSPEAVAKHGDVSFLRRHWNQMNKSGQYFYALQYEGLPEASAECPPIPAVVLAAMGPANEKGEIQTGSCRRVRRETINGCVDRLHGSRLCMSSHVCDCAAIKKQYGCDGVLPVVGMSNDSFRVEDWCMRTCDVCHDIDGSCFQSSNGMLSARWEMKGADSVRFHVEAETDEGDKAWVGVGFSCTGHMPGAHIVIATSSGATDMYAAGHSEPTADAHQDIYDVTTSVRDGSFAFSFTRPLESTDVTDNSLTHPLHILLAVGKINTTTGRPMQHTARTFSLAKVDFKKPCRTTPIHGSHTDHARPFPSPADPLGDCRFIDGDNLLTDGENLFKTTFSYPPEQVRWAPLENQGPYMVLPAYAAVGDPDDATRRVGLIKAGVDIRTVSLVMETIAESLLGQGGRVYAVQIDNTSGRVLGLAGASHGSVTATGGGHHRYWGSKAAMPWQVGEGVDKVINAHATVVREAGYVQWFRASDEEQEQLQHWDYNGGEYFVRFSAIDHVTDGNARHTPDSGLGLLVAVLLRRQTSIGDVDAAMAAAREKINSDEDAQEESRSKHVKTLGVMMTLFVVLLAMGAGFLVYKVAPSGVAIDTGAPGGVGIATQLAQHDSPAGAFDDLDDEMELRETAHSSDQ
eukprot:Hpha_TRINITY_DN16230_c2_g11::TRINITY_DN16230_c2_g11_i1::g.11464::m.11464